MARPAEIREELRSPLLLAARLIALLFCSMPAVGLSGPAGPKDRHVVLLVWDGMRPDLITERNTPALWKLARDGVNFRRHHSVYPTATNVNGAAIATGVYPNRSGLLANREYRPLLDPSKAFDTSETEIIRKADKLSGEKYLALPTVAEVVREAGLKTAIAGTKSVAFLHHRQAEWTIALSKDSFTKFAAAPMPSSLREETLRLLGPFLTGPAHSDDQRNAYATRALTEIFWRDDLPAFSLLWLSDPDLAQHDHSPGDDASMAAIRSSDRNLAVVLDALSKKNARETTDVLVASDHGFSTIERSIDFPAALRTAGFDAVAAFERAPKAGQVMVAGNAGTILFYIIEHDRAVTSRLVEWLQHSDFAGVIFTREKFEGTFPLEAVRANTPDAPDVMVALRWNPKRNRFGVPGQIITDAARGAGKGSHVTLSEFDVHNTLIASGPHFRRGMVNDLPSGNIDLAPTILNLLELAAPHKFDGRILAEAMAGDSAPPQPITETLEAGRSFSTGQWRQHLRISRVGETTYFDHGNGSFDSR